MNEKQVVGWCVMDKVYDEITDEEIDEIWNREPRMRMNKSD